VPGAPSRWGRGPCVSGAPRRRRRRPPCNGSVCTHPRVGLSPSRVVGPFGPRLGFASPAALGVLRGPALPSRALTASPRVSLGIALMPRSSAPPVTAATPSRTGHAWPASSKRCADSRHPFGIRSRRGSSRNYCECPGCCHESAPARRGSRQRAARTTGSADRHGWRGRARHQQDLSKHAWRRCKRARRERRVPVDRRLRTWSARRTLTAAMRNTEVRRAPQPTAARRESSNPKLEKKPGPPQESRSCVERLTISSCRTARCPSPTGCRSR